MGERTEQTPHPDTQFLDYLFAHAPPMGIALQLGTGATAEEVTYVRDRGELERIAR